MENDKCNGPQDQNESEEHQSTCVKRNVAKTESIQHLISRLASLAGHTTPDYQIGELVEQQTRIHVQTIRNCSYPRKIQRQT